MQALRQPFWDWKLRLSDFCWSAAGVLPKTKKNSLLFLIKRCDFHYARFLSTDESNFLSLAIDDISEAEQFLPSASHLYSVRISGWAGSPSLKIKEIAIHTSQGVFAIKPKKKREDVAAFYKSPKLLYSGFDTVVYVAADQEKVGIEVIEKSGTACCLNIPKEIQVAVVNVHEGGVHAGSIDSCSKIRATPWSTAAETAKAAGVNIINVAEVLIVAALLKECSELTGVLSNIPSGSDRRLDRLRFVLLQTESDKTEEAHEIISVRQLDNGGLGLTPSPQCVVVNNVIVHSGSVLIDHERNLIVADRAARPEFDFVSGQWEQVIGSHNRLHEAHVPQSPLENERVEKAVSLLGRIPENYFHSLIEYLPRYFTAMDSGLVNDHMFLLNDEYPSSVKFAAESLIPSNRIKYVGKEDSLLVEELLVPTFHTQTYDSTQIPWEYSGQMVWEPIQKFAEKMIELHLGPEQPSRDFFAIRTGGLRAIPNARKLIQIAQDEGFEILDLSTLSFIEQLNRLYWTRRMIIPGGAGLAGMIFMKPGASVLTLATAEQMELGTYRAMASHANIHLKYLLGLSTVAHGQATFRMNQIHAPFVISPKKFKNAIRDL